MYGKGVLAAPHIKRQSEVAIVAMSWFFCYHKTTYIIILNNFHFIAVRNMADLSKLS